MYVPQAHFGVSVPLKTLPPSPLSLSQAARSALTTTLPPTLVTWRKPALQWGLCKCCSNHFLGSKRKKIQGSSVLFQAVEEQEGAQSLGLQW